MIDPDSEIGDPLAEIVQILLPASKVVLAPRVKVAATVTFPEPL